jgi:hypothetical protein
MTEKELLDRIERELKNSTSTQYICEDGTIIITDVGYVEDWLVKYRKVIEREELNK